MRMIKVVYMDRAMSARDEKFETKPYPGDTAKEVAEGLKLMGCHDIEFVPVERAA